jgi:hypothetical protein
MVKYPPSEEGVLKKEGSWKRQRPDQKKEKK